LNILIADNFLFAEGLAEALRLHNFGEPLFLETANSTNEALELLQPDYNIDFDLLILDLSLSRMPLLRLLEYLQKNHRQLPILLTSSSDHQKDLMPAIRTGVMGYVEKSSHPDEIIHAVLFFISCTEQF